MHQSEGLLVLFFSNFQCHCIIPWQYLWCDGPAIVRLGGACGRFGRCNPLGPGNAVDSFSIGCRDGLYKFTFCIMYLKLDGARIDPVLEIILEGFD